MYNDYYLQQIDNKLATKNNNLDDIIENQQSIINNQVTIIENQQIDYSGDIITQQKIDEVKNANLMILFCILLAVIYKFVERVLR